MGKFYSAVAFLVLIGGCAPAATVPVYQPVEVKVPVAVGCKVTIPDHPPLPISTLTSTSTPATVVKAYAASIDTLEGVIHADEVLLASCINGHN